MLGPFSAPARHASQAKLSCGVLYAFGLLGIAVSADAYAAGSAAVAQGFLWVAILLLAAKLGTLVERLGQPPVFGEILAGVVIGNLALVGIAFMEPATSDPVITFLAELGAVILLFQLGLESDVRSMRRLGGRAAGVALIGVAAPFVIGTYLVGPMLLPGLSQNAYLFIGATLTATSVGITGRVFRDLGRSSMPEAQMVLGAAVIDDVLGLVILTVVASIAASGFISALEVTWISAQAIGFLIGSLVLGQLFAPHVTRFFARVHPGHGMKISVALGICLMFAYLAHLIGLAPIVGAFAAGLILEEAHFHWFDEPPIKREMLEAVERADPTIKARAMRVLERHAHKHLESMIEPIGHLFVPLFFVLAGMHVQLALLFDPNVIGVALALTAAAVIGKLVAGLAAGKRVNRWLVGWGMVPRGEVGLIFAFVGKSLGVVSDELFSVIVLMVLLTTLITPPILGYLLNKRDRLEVARSAR
jgi:Kef-type K+ transport system membrane component KefB